jgi:hypothetical protein
MGIPKRKTNIEIYKGSELTKRRQELLDNITKSDTNLPDSILHDDLDRGMLDYVTKTFKVVTDGKQIPIIDKKIKIIDKMTKMIMRKKNNLTNKTKNKLKIY